MHILCKKDEGIVMPNFVALRAAVFPLSTKNLRGADIRPPVGARVKVAKSETSRWFILLVAIAGKLLLSNDCQWVYI